MSVIMECRRSGLTDKAWCDQHDIPLSTFYNAVTRLRKLACDIPPATPSPKVIDLTARQEVVEVGIVGEAPNAGVIPAPISSPLPVHRETEMNLDNSHMIEIILGQARILAGDGADPELLRTAVLAAGSLLC